MHHLDTTSEEDEDECAHSVNAVNYTDMLGKEMAHDYRQRGIIFLIEMGTTIKARPAKFAAKIKPYNGVYEVEGDFVPTSLFDVEEDFIETTRGLLKDHKEPQDT